MTCTGTVFRLPAEFSLRCPNLHDFDLNTQLAILRFGSGRRSYRGGSVPQEQNILLSSATKDCVNWQFDSVSSELCPRLHFQAEYPREMAGMAMVPRLKGVRSSSSMSLACFSLSVLGGCAPTLVFPTAPLRAPLIRIPLNFNSLNGTPPSLHERPQR